MESVINEDLERKKRKEKKLRIPKFKCAKPDDPLNCSRQDLEYLKTVMSERKKYKAAHLKYAEDVCKMCSSLEYEDMPLDGLKCALEVRGFHTSGARENLIERLHRIDRGEMVPPQAYRPAQFEPPAMKNNYTNELIGLPHFLLRYLFEYLEYDSLLNAQMTCKYVFSDAQYVLKKRAVAFFGTENATVACFGALKSFKKMVKSGKYDRLDEDKYYKKFGVNLTREEGQGGKPLENGVVCIRKCVEVYGSIEEWLEYRDFAKAELELKHSEKKRLLADSSSREEQSKQMLYELGLPVFFTVGKEHTLTVADANFCSFLGAFGSGDAYNKFDIFISGKNLGGLQRARTALRAHVLKPLWDACMEVDLNRVWKREMWGRCLSSMMRALSGRAEFHHSEFETVKFCSGKIVFSASEFLELFKKIMCLTTFKEVFTELDSDLSTVKHNDIFSQRSKAYVYMIDKDNNVEGRTFPRNFCYSYRALVKGEMSKGLCVPENEFELAVVAKHRNRYADKSIDFCFLNRE